MSFFFETEYWFPLLKGYRGVAGQHSLNTNRSHSRPKHHTSRIQRGTFSSFCVPHMQERS
uniref:Uncharacterized protein n=1 Tax=Arundo donax TaxID=35708 RepID=A0A0A9CKD2_ARUDO